MTSASHLRIKTVWLLALLLGVFSPLGFAQGDLKIAWVDLLEVYNKCDKFLKVKEELMQTKQSKSEKMQQMDNALRSEFEMFNTQKELLPKERSEERQKELMDKRDKFIQTLKTEEETFNELKSQKFEPVLKEVQQVIEEIAKKEGYAFVFRRSYIAYGDPKYDITAKIIERLNKK